MTEQVGPFKVVGANEQQLSTMKSRGEFAAEYAKAMGWPIDPVELTFEQIMEIRRQPGWKNAR